MIWVAMVVCWLALIYVGVVMVIGGPILEDRARRRKRGKRI